MRKMESFRLGHYCPVCGAVWDKSLDYCPKCKVMLVRVYDYGEGFVVYSAQEFPLSALEGETK